MDVTTTVNTTYGGAASSPSIPFAQVLDVQNLYCMYDQNITVHVGLPNGTVTSQTAINHLTVNIPEGTTSVNVTQIDTGGILTDTINLQYFTDPPVTAKFGSGSNGM